MKCEASIQKRKKGQSMFLEIIDADPFPKASLFLKAVKPAIKKPLMVCILCTSKNESASRICLTIETADGLDGVADFLDKLQKQKTCKITGLVLQDAPEKKKSPQTRAELADQAHYINAMKAAAKISDEKLAERLGVKRVTVMRWRLGRCRISALQARQMVKAYGMDKNDPSAQALLRFADRMNSKPKS